jgi:hypothetical protein
MNRAQWKYVHRQMRIVWRESQKTLADVMIFGTGFTQFGPDVPDGIRHVPIAEMRDPNADVPSNENVV